MVFFKNKEKKERLGASTHVGHGGTLHPPIAEEAESGRYLRLNGHPSLTGKLQVSKKLSQNKLDKA